VAAVVLRWLMGPSASAAQPELRSDRSLGLRPASAPAFPPPTVHLPGERALAAQADVLSTTRGPAFGMDQLGHPQPAWGLRRRCGFFLEWLATRTNLIRSWKAGVRSDIA